jgi:hypothetical protein
MLKKLHLSLSISALCLTSSAYGEVRPIRFRNGSLSLSAMTPQQVQAGLSAAVAQRPAGHVIVQFESPVTPEMKDKLRASGVTLLDYLGDNAFFAGVSQARLNAAGLGAVPALTRVGEIQQGHKLHPDLLFNKIHDWMVVGARVNHDVDDGETPDGEGRPVVDPMVGVYIKFHKDVLLDPDAARIVHQFGAAIRSRLAPINSLVIELPYSQIKPLSDQDAVEWIEPPLPKLSVVNAENRVRTGADIVQAAPYGLNGAGVTVLVYDGGRVRTTHQDFQGRAQVGAGEETCTPVSDHSTHVAGTIGGAGVVDPTEKGMAPAVDIVSYGFNEGVEDCSLTSGGGWLYTDPGDLVADYTEAINTYGADISNNSIGTNTAPNNFPCSWEGDYGLCSSMIDAIVRGSVSPGGAPFRICWANGNERQVTRCNDPNPNVPAGYHTTAPPACAKNHIAVGALNSNDDSMTTFSSWGPSDDGRMKPDISAPGCESGGDGGVRSCGSASDTAYAVKCGTSMASPTVCGLSALLLQDFRVQFPTRPDFRNSTLKILLAHTAVDLGNPGPDNQFGYGSVRIQPCIDFMRSGNFLENTVDQGGSYNILVLVNPGDPELKITLAWDDPESGPVTVGTLVNDLDLVVLDSSSNQLFPWTLQGVVSPDNPSTPAVRTQKNSVDNIEQVYLANPPAGVYRVEVRGFNVPQGPQPFSLCASPLLVNCSRQGTAALDKAVYPCSATATLTVIDCDLNTDDQVVETVNVTIDSTSEPGGETVTLTETGAQTALFRGTIDLSTTNSAGVLQVAHGDTVTLTYNDADDGQGGINVTVTDTASVDCVAPVISNVATSNLGPHTATVTFDTDEPARGTVRYGTACGSLTGSVQEAAFGASHTLVITGLLDDTQYFFAVDAADPAGNSSTDDNGGACYTFTTPEIPDSFTEEFTAADFDLDNTSLQFTPNGSIDFYALCATSIAVLPTDPAGGTVLTLNDNFSVNVALGGGAQVSLYGVNYGSFFVGSNGYITFTAGDTDSSPTVADHFDTPRISALFANLNPALGGTVSWKQLADRAVVTWENVPQASTTNSNTLQVEMYFDGRLRISFLTVDLTAGITGLSAGGGIPPDFTEMDLSAAAACGPQPPAAASRTLETPVSINLDITLIAGDDGIPGPLSYIITTLPASPLEDLGNSYTITPGDLPYTLSGGGNQVRYHSGATPTTDSFQFKVNDGGTPPDGGDSNTATVTINVQPVLALPFFDDFPTTTFDPLKWALVDTATIDAVGIAEPSEPNSARFNGDPNGGDEIRSHLINLSGETAVRLKYWFEIRGGGESPDTNDDLFVEFLNNVGSWQLINQHLGADPDMTTYQQVSVLLPASAFHTSFRLRFRNTATSGANDDWFVDDVSLSNGNIPEAFNSAVTAPFNGFLDITLSANDITGDTLSFIILSLPANGTLKDPGAGLADIVTVPYTLAGNGNVVRYVPNTGFSGTNQFTFKANDGTFDSNVATVTIAVEPVLTLPFYDEFPATTFDTGKWGLVSNATIDDVGIAEPSAPYSARFNGNPSGADELRTFAINLASEPAVRLSYWFELRGGGGSPETGDDLVVEYADNVGAWQELQRHLGSGADMTNYQQVTMLLPAGASHASFRLRFRSTGGTGAADDDWFVDDVAITNANAPMASHSSVTAPFNGFLDITLSASDPNLDPLSYIILSLPANGTLKDPGAGLTDIVTVPYTLAANGSVVRYVPNTGFGGQNQFTFKANDGAFDSNVATVSIAVEPVLSLPFFDDFPTTTFDPGKWGLVQNATIDGVGIAEPSEPNSARFNGLPVTGGDEIRTFAINLGAETAVQLTYYFEVRGGGDSPEAGDDLFVEYWDGAAWVILQQHLGSLPDMTTYQLVDMLLPAGALHSSFRLRIRTASPLTTDDWFVDDVSLVSLNVPVAQSTAATTAVNTAVSIPLPASDPNGDTMTWIIQSLPTSGLLKDPNGPIITTVPYALLGNGDDVLYKAAFNYQGSDAFTFKATDGTYDSNVANVDVTIGGPQSIHSFPLDTDPGWSADPGPGGTGPNNSGWAFGTPTGTPCGNGGPDPTGGFTGANVYGYNLAGCYTGLLTPTRWLTTTALDCSGATGIQLRFRRWLGVESASFDHVYIDVSTNGSTWTNIWTNPTSPINEQAWTLQTYDASSADNQPTVYFRWGMGPTDLSLHYQGWNIDDIEVVGLVPQDCPPVTLGDINGDTRVDGQDIQGMAQVLTDPFLVTAAQQCAADVDQNNALDTADAEALATLLLSLP